MFEFVSSIRGKFPPLRQWLYGSTAWQPFERQIWVMVLAASAVWCVYVVIFDIVFFKPRSYERHEQEVVIQEHRTFGDFMSNFGQAPSSGTIAQLEGRRSRNVERQARNLQTREYNANYVWRGLKKAFGYPLAWLAALLSFITIYERLRESSKSDE